MHPMTTDAAVVGTTTLRDAAWRDELRAQARWLTASVEVTRQLCAGGDGRSYDALVPLAVLGADADLAVLVSVIDDGHVGVAAVVGAEVEHLRDRVLERRRTLVGRVLAAGAPVLLEDADGVETTDLPDTFSGAIGAPVPVPGSRVPGALILARSSGRAPFTGVDRDRLGAFVDDVAIAQELDRARNEREAMRRGEDHDRIAAHLHNDVIGGLMTTGLGLESLVARLSSPEQQARVLGYVEALEVGIRQIRTAVFQLHPGGCTDDDMLRRLIAVLDDAGRALGFAAAVQFSGRLDRPVPVEVADDLVDLVRAALAGTARYARATTASVRLAMTDALLTVDVVDNGRGTDATHRANGLTDLRRRAATQGGVLEFSEPDGGGTRVHWTAPLP